MLWYLIRGVTDVSPPRRRGIRHDMNQISNKISMAAARRKLGASTIWARTSVNDVGVYTALVPPRLDLSPNAFWSRQLTSSAARNYTYSQPPTNVDAASLRICHASFQEETSMWLVFLDPATIHKPVFQATGRTGRGDSGRTGKLKRTSEVRVNLFPSMACPVLSSLRRHG
jgi:hypothetical protein